LLDQLNEFLVLILIASAIISFFIGLSEYRRSGEMTEFVDAGAIMAIVVLNAILGVVQEGRAEEALAALKKMAAPNALVLRDGHQLTIPARELVPGDVVILETGNYVPADVRLIESVNLRVEEASLTGESVPVGKHAEEVVGEDAVLGDVDALLVGQYGDAAPAGWRAHRRKGHEPRRTADRRLGLRLGLGDGGLIRDGDRDGTADHGNDGHGGESAPLHATEAGWVLHGASASWLGLTAILRTCGSPSYTCGPDTAPAHGSRLVCGPSNGKRVPGNERYGLTGPGAGSGAGVDSPGGPVGDACSSDAWVCSNCHTMSVT